MKKTKTRPKKEVDLDAKFCTFCGAQNITWDEEFTFEEDNYTVRKWTCSKCDKYFWAE